jgi:hypothetical protein
MACGITSLSSVATCNNDIGGIARSFMCNLADITAVTLTSGVISGFTMASTGLWKQMTYDKDDTAYYNQTGARANPGAPLVATQTSFLKFKGMSSAYITAANAAKDCCNVVLIHVLNNGARIVQGIVIDATAVGGFSGTKTDTRVTPSVMSDTGANQSRLEYLIEGTAYDFSPTTSLTDSAILAL